MNNMIKYIKNLFYILEHKKNVMIECLEFCTLLKTTRQKIEIIKRGLLHDMSKFSYIEFKEYSEYFFGNKNKEKFNIAWEHHYKLNSHHPENWQYTKNAQIDMSYMDIVEMICDWSAMSRKFGDTPQDFYLTKARFNNFSLDTRLKIEYMLGLIHSFEYVRMISFHRTLSNIGYIDKANMTLIQSQYRALHKNSHRTSHFKIFKRPLI